MKLREPALGSNLGARKRGKMIHSIWLRKGICISVAIVTLFLLTIPRDSAFASGTGHHHHSAESSDHMKSMMALKESIPDEYQVMERTPVHPTEESLNQGQQLFLKNCSVCHGNDGAGKGPASANLKIPPANFLDKAHSAIYGPGEKFWIIGNGTGQTGMPAFSDITPIDRWHLVNYILQLQNGGTKEKADMGHSHK